MDSISWLRRNWAFLFLGFVAIAWIYAAHSGDQMHQRAKFTIGYITGWHLTAKSGKYYEFHFMVRDSVYEGNSSTETGMDRRNGARFVVEYDSLNPGTNVGHFAVIVPNVIQQPPRDGWRTPPFPVPAWIINHE